MPLINHQTTITENQTSLLRVVLFTSDQAVHFRPNKDDSQWFHRRDALVRCVASFLHGPATGSNSQCNSQCKRELVILFDQDWTTIYMSLDETSADNETPLTTTTYPTEQSVLSLWKLASEHSGQVVTMNGLFCRLVPSQSAAQTCTMPTSMQDKRDILKHLQSTCDLDFLRRHHLNSSAAVVLKKTNKQALLNIWDDWMRTHGSTVATTSSTTCNGSSSSAALEEILETLLQPQSPELQRVIAGTLHETSDLELPYWNKFDAARKDSSCQNTQLCLFLGAVRDMTDAENATLRNACAKLHVPYTGVRIGPVAEFTSKILTIVAYHDAHGRLCSAVKELISKSHLSLSSLNGNAVSHLASMTLDVICLANIPSHDLVIDLERRTAEIWQLVRCTVVTLWRSRLAGSSRKRKDAIVNRLTIVFDDGISVTLNASDVQAMAESHQAAPCEHQIIQMLLTRLEESRRNKKTLTSGSALSPKEVALNVVRSLADDMDSKRMHALNLTSDEVQGEGVINVADFCYHKAFAQGEDEVKGERIQRILALVSLHKSKASGSRWERAFMRAFRKVGIAVLNLSLQCAPFADQVGASITLLQHLCYQKQLLRMIHETGPIQRKASNK
ncbi:hypothetical protein MPSEU_000918300 [Mayamaea pseudoterrestris]|nr:hypothetical protein MPSEU_000918300 [Mayamaea pseudoterrestris]